MPKKILVADDEAHIRHIVSTKLSNAGFEVVTATDGEEALEVCLAEKPDMIITDFQMPYMTGVEFCIRLRESEQAADAADPARELSSPARVPVLMLTARGFDIEPHEMVAAGIVDVLSKPFSPREILAKVRRMLSESEQAPHPVSPEPPASVAEAHNPRPHQVREQS